MLVDLLMPVMNGVELIDWLRGDARWSHLPVIVMTAAGEKIIGVDLESLNVPVLQKPLDLVNLSQVLAATVRVTVEFSSSPADYR